MSWSCTVLLSCYGAVQSLSGDAERDVAVEAVGQGECSLYSEDTVTDEEGRFRLRGLLVSTQGSGGFIFILVLCLLKTLPLPFCL